MTEQELETCGVCGQPRPRDKCKIIKLSLEERQFLRKQGQEPQTEYVYCQPCWRTLSNPVQGPNLGKGLIQARLRQLGVSNAEEIASEFHRRLLSRIAQPKSS